MRTDEVILDPVDEVLVMRRVIEELDEDGDLKAGTFRLLGEKTGMVRVSRDLMHHLGRLSRETGLAPGELLPGCLSSICGPRIRIDAEKDAAR